LASAAKKSAGNSTFASLAISVANRLRQPLSWFFGKETLAGDTSYCAIAGSVSGQQTADKKTKLIFSSVSLLAPDETYYIIVKGDPAANSGVRSFWEVGLNALASPVANTNLFNGINYPGAYIWSVKTLPSTKDNPQGICTVDHAAITPNSYLFQTTVSDPNENDFNAPIVSSANNFDTIADGDKVFTAEAISSDANGDQVLHPVVGYGWNWNWGVDNTAVVNFVPGVNFVDADGNSIADVSSQLVRAVPGVTDNKTKVNANINMIAPTPAASISASADIHVFVCNNPWPPVKNDGTWEPWNDQSGNCAASAALGLPCNNSFNYELYYCRDNGGGPSADLPTISGDVTLGTSGDVLKESYFFQGGVPQSTITLAMAGYSRGGAIDLRWNAPATDPTNGAVVSYKLYYDIKPGAPYANIVSPISLSDSPSYHLDGLTNGTTYYAAVTAIYKNGAESAYSPEISFSPKDVFAPPTPTMLPIAAGRDRVALAIKVALDSKASSAAISLVSPGSAINTRILREVSQFKVDYGTTEAANSLSSSTAADAMLNNNKTIILHNLATSSTEKPIPYYLTFSALNSAGAVASTSIKVKIILYTDKAAGISAAADSDKGKTFALALRVLNDKINVAWNANSDDTVGYKLFYGVSSGQYGNTPQTIQGANSTTASFPINNIHGTYYVTLMAFDASGNESAPAAEQSITPLP
jgi:hypothetical protein